MLYVTGGAGFIGSNFIKMLNYNKINAIVIVDELGSDDKWKNLRGLVFRDIINPKKFLESADKIVSTNDIIVHLGACSSTTEKNVDFLWENNVQYSKKLTDFSVKCGIKFLYASSASVYGLGEFGFSDACDKDYEYKLRPLNPYGFSKLSFDKYVLQSGYEKFVTGLRFFNVWGNNESHKHEQASLISRITPKLLNGEKIILFKHKTKQLERDFIWVEDVCRVIMNCIISDKINGIYNVGSGTAKSWTEITESLAKALKVPAKIKYVDIPTELIKQYQFSTKADVTKLKTIMNFNPTQLDVALMHYVEEYKKA